MNTRDDLPPPERLAVGDFVLERSQQRLLRGDGSAIDLSPRLFGALLVLVGHAGELLDKDWLLQALWPGLVVEENNLNQVVAALRRALGDDAVGSRYIQTVPRRGFRFVAPVTALAASGPAAPGAGAPKRLAVLPFKPIVAEARDELLELGMADSLITRLSTLPWLAVLSVGSVRRHAGIEQDPTRAARELDVGWVVDGTLQRANGRLRISARLLRAADGVAAWAGSFAVPAADVFEVQDRIADQVAQALAPVLHASHDGLQPAREPGGTRNPDAYRLYLQARALMLHQRGDGLRDSIALFERAIDADPAYARAWVGLADAHRRLSFVGNLQPARAYAEVERALRRALALVPDLPDADATLAMKHVAFDFDWRAGESAFRRAVRSNPSLPLAQFGLGQLMLVLDARDEGFGHLRRARELDPVQPLYAALEASFLRVAGRGAEAASTLEKALAKAPAMPLLQLVRAQALWAGGQADAALAALRQAAALAGGAHVFDGLLGHYLALHGRRDEARAVLASLRAQAATGYVAPTAIAVVHAGLGETAPAIDALEQAWRVRDARLGFIKDQPYWDGLRGEPRFRALLRRIGLDRFGRGYWNP
jgi:DNA-binding winged helix-turn-helix (wHTH) protein/tetratricopeptide (TPR) repeat protein